mgnify:CR=1 FL=1
MEVASAGDSRQVQFSEVKKDDDIMGDAIGPRTRWTPEDMKSGDVPRQVTPLFFVPIFCG